MLPDDVRALALMLPELWEGAHMGQTDFRIRRTRWCAARCISPLLYDIVWTKKREGAPLEVSSARAGAAAPLSLRIDGPFSRLCGFVLTRGR